MSVKVKFITEFDTKKLLRGKLAVAALGAAFLKLGKDSVAAAMADQKAQTALNRTLINMGWAKQTQQVNGYIASLENLTGIADDELRPAFTSLFLATKNANAAQTLLGKSLDYSAGTGKSLSEVTDALSRAIAGNRRGLLSLGTGLDKTFLQTAPLVDVFQMLDQTFAGQLSASLDTAAVKMDILTLAVSNAKENIGYGFINALDMGQGQVEGFRKQIEYLGIGFGYLAGKVIGATSSVVDFLSSGMGKLLFPSFAGTKFDNRKVADPIGTLHDSIGGAGSDKAKEQTALEKLLAKIEKQRAEYAKQLAAAKAKQTAQAARQLQLAKLSAKFNLELAGIAAAKGRTTDTGTLNRLSVLDVLAQDAAGLPVSAAALKKAQAAANNITVNIQGSVVSERDLVQAISEQIGGSGPRGRYLPAAL